MVGNGNCASWKQEKHSIQAEYGDWKLKIDPYDPKKLMTVNRGSLPNLIEMALMPMPAHHFRPEEIYIREEDLITRYTQSESDLISLQVDWRLLTPDHPFAFAFEVWISVQTRLLNVHPTLRMRLDGPTAWHHSQHCELAGEHAYELQFAAEKIAAWKSVSQDAFCLWIIDPRDQPEFAWDSNPDSRLQATLFGSFLEKGVIRRARFRFYLSSTSVPKEAVKAAYDDLITSSLPLTA